MNSKLGNMLAPLKRAVKKYEEILKEKKTEIVRDSAIQRFEFTFELAWKAMKARLEEKGIKELYSPKDVIKAAFQNGLIARDHIWLDMLDTRNKTSHLYKDAMADEVYSELPAYLPLIKNLLKEIS